MRRGSLIAAALALGCATAPRSKGDPVAPFAPAGTTDEAARLLRHSLLVGIDAFLDARFAGFCAMPPRMQRSSAGLPAPTSSSSVVGAFPWSSAVDDSSSTATDPLATCAA